MSFAGKTVAITGAAGGIGQALCRYFGKAGATIAALDKNDDVTSFAVDLGQEGIRAAAEVVELSDAKAVAAAFARLTQSLGAIDVLVNNAGGSNVSSLSKTTPEDWERIVAGNLHSAYYCAHVVLPPMVEKRAGAIVNVVTVNAFSALGDPAYSAGKAGLLSLTQAMAMEYGRYNIRVNAVCPGTVRTPAWQRRISRNPEIMTQLAKWYPLGRVVEPTDVANAIGFLASDAAAAITGVALPVDCGLTAGNIVMSRELTLENF